MKPSSIRHPSADCGDITRRIRGVSVIEGFRTGVTGNELSRRLQCRIQSEFQSFELGAAAGEGLSGTGGRS
jgi:hypothetical protein